jgi:cation:H+ antiporter
MGSGMGDIALANVLGSNVVNILLIVGLAACVAPIKVKNHVIKKELPILLVVTSMFCLCIISHKFGISNQQYVLDRQDGFMLLCFFGMFMFYILSVVQAKQGILEYDKPKYGIVKSIIYSIICCVVILLSSDLVVDNAVSLAELIGVSTKIITMTVVVIGTSLPEMTMTVIAAKKGEFDFALGNIIGTNIFNIGVVLGLPLVIYGGFNSTSFNMVDVTAVFIAAISLFLFARNDKKLSSLEGALMMSIFVMYYAYVLLT